MKKTPSSVNEKRRMKLSDSLMLDAASGLTGISCPILYCTEDYHIVDMNKAAFGSGFCDMYFGSVERLISSFDRQVLHSLMFALKNALQDSPLHAVIKLSGPYPFSFALAVPKSFFGRYLYEFRLFKTLEELLGMLDNIDIFAPVLPDDDPEKGARGAAYSLLANCHMDVLSGKGERCSFEIERAFERIDLKLTSLGIGGGLCDNIVKGRSKICSASCSKGFFKILVTASVLLCAISDRGRITGAAFSGRGDSLLTLQAELSGIPDGIGSKVALGALPYYFPECSFQALAFRFICDIYGVGSLVKITKDGKINLIMHFPVENGEGDYSVNHYEIGALPEKEIASALRLAETIARL